MAAERQFPPSPTTDIEKKLLGAISGLSRQLNQHMMQFTQFAVEVKQQMADINARLISMEEHSQNCSLGEEPTRKRRRVHNPKVAVSRY